MSAQAVPEKAAVAPTTPLVKDFKKRLEALRTERQSFVAHWRDLSDYFLPRRSRFLSSERNLGTKRNEKIIDATGTMAARTLSAGMMSGLTSPARPWFRLGVPDPDLMDDGDVRAWLWDVEKRMQAVFAKSNLYDSLPLLYGDLGVFGTAALGVLEDEDEVIRTFVQPIGSYMIANDARGRVNCLYREYSMTVLQLVERFGYEAVSDSTRRDFDNKVWDAWREVVQAVEVNPDYDDRYLDSRLKRFRSVYWEKAATDNDRVLSVAGFDEFPFMVPRWSVMCDDIYGGSPGMDALPDVKMLQLMQKRKYQGIEKMVNPPMLLSPELENKNFSLLPGALNYGRSVSGAPAAVPAHPLNLPLNYLMQDIMEVQQRVQRAMYEDLFLMIANTDRRQITAREIDERHEEKLLQLGPVLERVNDELLSPLIERTFAIMLRRGMIPEAPEELQGVELTIEYISIMAQAQKVVHTASVDKYISFVGACAAASPDVVDNVDFDEAARDYADQLGVSPKLVRDKEDVEGLRAQRQQAQQAQQAMQTALGAVEAAKGLGQTPVGAEGDNALTGILRNMGAA